MLLSVFILFFLVSPAGRCQSCQTRQPETYSEGKPFKCHTQAFNVTSLKCYVCNSSTTNEECNKNSQTCQQPLDTCMTIVDTLGYMKAIVKQCASSATCKGLASTASVDRDGNGNTVNCCNYDSCNMSAADSVHCHTALPLFTLSFLLMLRH